MKRTLVAPAHIEPQPKSGPLRPQPPGRRHPLRAVALAVLLAALLGGCTFHSGKQIEVSYTGTRYRFTIYQMPSAALVGLRLQCQGQHGQARETWSRCSLTYLRNRIHVSSVATLEWNHFTEGGRWADYAGAIEDVVKCSVFLRDISEFKNMNQAYAEFFPGPKPARAMARFGADIPGVLVAIEAIATV